MPGDNLSGVPDSLSSPARRAWAVTPHNTNELTALPKALLIGGAGDIVLRASASLADVTLTVAAGQCLPIRASHVRATGTTATNIVALA